MSAVTSSFFHIPEDKIPACVLSGCVSCAMVSGFGIATILARSPNGGIDPAVARCITAAPFMGARIIEKFIPCDTAGIYLGSVAGIAIPLLFGSTDLNYAVGGLVGACTSVAISAARVKLLQAETKAAELPV